MACLHELWHCVYALNIDVCNCVCNVFSSEINSTELEARNPLTPLRGGYAGYQNL